MSCNGCRVLRKGCSPDCTLKPCLDWIPSPDSQANAVVFLAKFYGRAGLVNLINAGPDNLHPEIFKSLLYEACGRIINPVGGATGLMGSGEWARCQAAVDAVLDGSPLMMEISGDGDSGSLRQDPRQSSNIRRIKRYAGLNSTAANDTNEVPEKFTITGWEGRGDDYESSSSGDVGRARRSPATAPVSRVTNGVPSPEVGLELTLGPRKSHR